MTSQAGDDFLTTTEVAELLACSRDTVIRAVDAGDIEAVRYGRLIRIRRSEFDRFLEAYTTSGPRPRPRRRYRTR
jgi:excisionase family DNA binding protein